LYYWSNEANYWQTWSIARPLCDSWATCSSYNEATAQCELVLTAPNRNIITKFTFSLSGISFRGSPAHGSVGRCVSLWGPSIARPAQPARYSYWSTAFVTLLVTLRENSFSYRNQTVTSRRAVALGSSTLQWGECGARFAAPDTTRFAYFVKLLRIINDIIVLSVTWRWRHSMAARRTWSGELVMCSRLNDVSDHWWVTTGTFCSSSSSSSSIFIPRIASSNMPTSIAPVSHYPPPEHEAPD